MKLNRNHVGLVVAGASVAALFMQRHGCFERAQNSAPLPPLLANFGGKDFGTPQAIAAQMAVHCRAAPELEQRMFCNVSSAYLPPQFRGEVAAVASDEGRIRKIEVSIFSQLWARCKVTTPCVALSAAAAATSLANTRAALLQATTLLRDGLGSGKSQTSSDRVADVALAAKRALPLLAQAREQLGALYRSSPHVLDEIGLHTDLADWAVNFVEFSNVVHRDKTYEQARSDVRQLAAEATEIADIVHASSASGPPPGGTVCGFAAPIFLSLLAPTVGTENLAALAARIPFVAMENELPPLASDVTLFASGNAESCVLEIRLHSKPMK